MEKYRENYDKSGEYHELCVRIVIISGAKEGRSAPGRKTAAKPRRLWYTKGTNDSCKEEP